MTTDERYLQAIKEDPRLELLYVKTYILTMLKEGIEPNKFIIERMVDELKWRNE